MRLDMCDDMKCLILCPSTFFPCMCFCMVFSFFLIGVMLSLSRPLLVDADRSYSGQCENDCGLSRDFRHVGWQICCLSVPDGASKSLVDTRIQVIDRARVLDRCVRAFDAHRLGG